MVEGLARVQVGLFRGNECGWRIVGVKMDSDESNVANEAAQYFRLPFFFSLKSELNFNCRKLMTGV